MSIFPKKNWCGKTVELHLHIFNNTNQILKVEAVLYIFGPDNSLVRKIFKKFSCRKKQKNLVFKIKTENFVCGKYKVISFIRYKRQYFLSETYTQDYFIIKKTYE